jgi:hypothetical protein
MHLSLLHPLGTMSHRVSEGGPEKENTKLVHVKEKSRQLNDTIEKEIHVQGQESCQNLHKFIVLILGDL